MNVSTETRALLWKEFRQAVPLIVMVLILGCILSGIFLIQVLLLQRPIADITSAFVVMPMIFATGIGVLMVGGDKDQRTLQWLQSLPVHHQKIAWCKLVATITTLIGVWLASVLLVLVLAAISPADSAVGQAPTLQSSWGFLLTSLFLAIAGNAMSWRLQSPVAALLSLVPLSFGLGAINYVLTESTGWYPHESLGKDVVFACVVIASTVAVGVYGWFASRKYLAGTQGWSLSLARLGWSIRESSAGAIALHRASTYPTHALLWQTMKQGQGWLIGVGLLCAPLLFISASVPYSEPRTHPWLEYVDPLQQLALVTLGLCACWLGCYVFLGDSYRQRVRFLANRGISPSRVWWTRQWVPLTLIFVASLVRIVARGLQGESIDRMVTMLFLDLSIFLTIGIAIYVIGQWIGQCIPSPIVCLSVAPIAVMVFWVYAIGSYVVFEAPIWTFAISLGLLVLATWWQMFPWMNRSTGWGYYAAHGVFLLVALCVPLAPGLFRIASMERMPREIKQRLLETLQRDGDRMVLVADAYPKALAWPLQKQFETAARGEGLWETYRMIQRNFKRKNELLQLSPKQGQAELLVPAWGNKIASDYAHEVVDARLRLNAGPSEENRSRYRLAVDRCLECIEVLRKPEPRDGLSSIDLAEALEIMLLREMKLSSIETDLGQDRFRKVARLLSDQQTRDAIRRKVLAESWRWSRSVTQSDELPRLGGYTLSNAYPTSLVAKVKLDLEVDRRTTELWRVLEQPKEYSRSVRSTDNEPLGPVSDWTGDVVWITVGERYSRSPGFLWRGAWEREAAALATKLVPTEKEKQ